ncbi:hypothetical protein BurJ1DRAFT_4138 [Burkholderiales bacterium JOSHI_001]|nr:hypothetical protein BurJ1DRAFT_4138 [Burkholderiales bacterium JOSHI_001]
MGRNLFSLMVAGLVCACGGSGDAPDTAAIACSAPGTVAAGGWPGMCLSGTGVSLVHQELLSRARRGTLMSPIGGFDPRFYPAEVLVSVAALANDRGDQELKAWVAEQLNVLGQSLAQSSGYLIWPILIDGAPAFGSNSQSRLVIGLALLNLVEPSDRIKALARQAFDALDRMPRLAVRSSVTGRTYLLPAYTFQQHQAPIVVSSRQVDPNQDAALALAYALAARHLAKDEQDASAIAAQGRALLDATMDLAAGPDCLPLVDDPAYLAVCDTRYNGFWLALAHKADLLLNGAGSARTAALGVQYNILKRWWSVGSTSRAYPARYEGAFPDPIEPVVALAAVAALGSGDDWRSHRTALEQALLGTSPAGWPAGWLYPRAFARLAP